jgi:hypothetical protein
LTLEVHEIYCEILGPAVVVIQNNLVMKQKSVRCISCGIVLCWWIILPLSFCADKRLVLLPYVVVKVFVAFFFLTESHSLLTYDFHRIAACVPPMPLTGMCMQ